MPSYDFECGCGEQLSIVQEMNEAHDATCPKCKSNMNRVYSLSPVLFKGHPRWFDPKKAAIDANYSRWAYNRTQETKRV